MSREDPLFLPDPVVSRSELWVRAVCGAVFGALAGIHFVIQLNPVAVFWNVVIFVASVAGFAWGAAKFGDRFWHGLRHWG